MSPLSVEAILNFAVERLELGEPQEKPVLVDAGEASSFLQELTVEDLKIELDIQSLPDYLAVFKPAEEIIRMHNVVFKHSPWLKTAKKADCDGDCKSCDKGSGTSCEEKEG